jgi:hypothetical protein
VSQALSLLQHPQERQGLVPSWSPFPFAGDATGKNWLTSLEATPLTTNSLTVARLMGLRILQHNADADAVDLVLPLLKDRYALVRSRALSLLQSVTDQDLPENDPKAWDQWWATNRATFGVRHPAGPTPPSQSSE